VCSISAMWMYVAEAQQGHRVSSRVWTSTRVTHPSPGDWQPLRRNLYACPRVSCAPLWMVRWLFVCWGGGVGCPRCGGWMAAASEGVLRRPERTYARPVWRACSLLDPLCSPFVQQAACTCVCGLCVCVVLAGEGQGGLLGAATDMQAAVGSTNCLRAPPYVLCVFTYQPLAQHHVLGQQLPGVLGKGREQVVGSGCGPSCHLTLVSSCQVGVTPLLPPSQVCLNAPTTTTTEGLTWV
jgi:hypothetical protein